ncbi:hypothetical protein [Mycolicibacterium mengxianglii]|uniref:hypothetical protein n=1 Tax=Mycolicibacterium mengxianglii TaxID=2736649 RepID=UPI0018D190A9|nr:hypothetical protein [Mycolicibacterium mengxianglii]
MAANETGVTVGTKRFTAFTLGSFACAVALMSVGTPMASADVEEMAPSPQVSSRQALLVDENALRTAAIGEARGAGGNSGLGDAGVVTAQGEVRDGVKAVAGTTAAPFNLEQNGSFQFSPPIGDW